MNTRPRDLETRDELATTLRAWLASEAPAFAPTDLRRRVLGSTAGIAQRMRWIPIQRIRIDPRSRMMLAGVAVLGVVAAVVGLDLLSGDLRHTVGSSPPVPSRSAPGGADPGAWVRAASAPLEPGPTYLGIVEGKVLALAYDRPLGQPTGDMRTVHLLEYDLVGDRWTDRGPVDPRAGLLFMGSEQSSAVAIVPDIYLIGHAATTGGAWELAAWPIDRRTLLGTRSTPAPLPGTSGVVRGMDGRIYVLETPANGTEDQAPQELRIYDPAADVWTSGPAIPNPRADALLAADPKGGVYVIGGTNVPVWTSSDASVVTPLRSLERYDPANNSWDASIAMPFDLTASFTAATVASDGALYVVILHDAPSGRGFVVSLHRFDPHDVAWSLQDVPEEWVTPAALYGTDDARLILLGGKAYAFDGVIWEAHHQQPSVTWIRDLPVP